MMARWLKSRDRAVCPMTGEPIVAAGSKWSPRAEPCEHDGTRCEHLSNCYAGCNHATVQCRYKRGAP